MVVCTFYQRGNCKFGDSCRNEHPGSARDGSNNNRFGAFGGGDRYRPGQSNGSSNFGSARDSTSSFHVDRDTIKEDLDKQRPGYPLSCYGPGKDAPRQLIEGPVELSPEELRLRYYTLRVAGNEAQAQQEEAALLQKMESQVKAILADIPGAIRYIEDGAKVHPNRIDIAKGNAQTPNTANNLAGTQNASPFGAASAVGQKPSPFGQTSTLGGSSAFGRPAFGTSGFGQASMPGTGSAFGQASSLTQGSAFGQTSTPGTASGFGQTNALGQKPSPFSTPGFGQSGFGQTAQPNANASPFGQPAQANPSPFAQQAPSNSSPFGQQSSSAASPFGQQAANTNPNPFSKAPANPFSAAAPAQGTAFGKPAFGQPASMTQTASPFGQPSNPGQQTLQPSPFGQQTQAQQAPTANPFSTAASTQGSSFGKPAFGQPSNPSPFGAQQVQNSAAQPGNPFMKAQPSAPAATPATFGTPSQPANPFGQAQQQAPAQSAPGAIDPKERFKEGKPEEYEGQKGKILEEIYKRVGQMGRFNDNEDIPITPPKCEWITPMQIL